MYVVVHTSVLWYRRISQMLLKPSTPSPLEMEGSYMKSVQRLPCLSQWGYFFFTMTSIATGSWISHLMSPTYTLTRPSTTWHTERGCLTTAFMWRWPWCTMSWEDLFLLLIMHSVSLLLIITAVEFFYNGQVGSLQVYWGCPLLEVTTFSGVLSRYWFL